MMKYRIKTTNPEVKQNLSLFLKHIEYTEADFIILDLLEDSMLTNFECTQRLKADGYILMNAQGNMVSHPAMKIKIDSQTKIYNILKVLGGNPADRKKLNSGADPDSNLESDLEKYLKS